MTALARLAAGKGAESRAMALLSSHGVDLVVWGEIRPGEKFARAFVAGHVPWYNYASGALLDVSSLEKFVDKELADHLFHDVHVYAFPWADHFTTPEEKKRYAEKLDFLLETNGPREWAPKSANEATVLFDAAWLYTDYAADRNSGDEAGTAVQLYDLAFHRNKVDPENPPVYGDIDWRSPLLQQYRRALKLLAKLNRNLDAARKAVRIAEIYDNTVAFNRSDKPWGNKTELADVLLVESQLTGDPATKARAALNACYAVVELRKSPKSPQASARRRVPDYRTLWPISPHLRIDD